MVLATEEALTEITRNLVENAVGHAPAGSEVTITLARNGTLSIVDHGPGIPEMDRGHLFEQFGEVHRPRVPAAGLASPLSQKPVNALAQTFDV